MLVFLFEKKSELKSITDECHEKNGYPDNLENPDEVDQEEEHEYEDNPIDSYNNVESLKYLIKPRYFNKEKPESYLNLLFFHQNLYTLDEAVIFFTLDQIKDLKRLGYFPNSITYYNGQFDDK